MPTDEFLIMQLLVCRRLEPVFVGGVRCTLVFFFFFWCKHNSLVHFARRGSKQLFTFLQLLQKSSKMTKALYHVHLQIIPKIQTNWHCISIHFFQLFLKTIKVTENLLYTRVGIYKTELQLKLKKQLKTCTKSAWADDFLNCKPDVVCWQAGYILIEFCLKLCCSCHVSC